MRFCYRNRILLIGLGELRNLGDGILPHSKLDGALGQFLNVVSNDCGEFGLRLFVAKRGRQTENEGKDGRGRELFVLEQFTRRQ
mmetsp:Transcript_31072/g.93204  ORF Transcript_31072/g.93204 Transcript_31072/m.93204 type:complete len:84 (-) Transcript_31072:727-978(-)